LPQDPLFAAGRALTPSAGGVLASIALRALPAAPAPPQATSPNETDVILPPRRVDREEPGRLEPLEAAKLLEARGVPVPPLYESLTRLYYEDGAFRWRFESLGLVLRDPRRPWLPDRPSLVVFAEGRDGTLYAFDGPSVVACDARAREPTAFAPSFDAFVARVLGQADRTGAVEVVLAALGLSGSR
jgi:hypothetical protein